MDPTSSERGSEFVHVMLKFRTRNKMAKLSRALDTSLSSYVNLRRLIYKHFPEIEDVGFDNSALHGTRASSRLEVKWKDPEGNLIVLENDEDLEAVDLAQKCHIELHIETSSNPTLSTKNARSANGANPGETSNGLNSTRANNHKTRPCRHFQAGHCKYGEACRFSHNEITTDRPQRQGGSSAGSGAELQQNASPGHPVTVHEDDIVQNFTSSRTGFERRTTLRPVGSTNLDIDSWLVRNLELTGAQAIQQLSDGEGLGLLQSVVEKRKLHPETVNLLVRILAKEDMRTSLLKQKTNRIYGVLIGSPFLQQLQSHITSYLGIQNAEPKALQPYLFLIEELQSRTEEGWKEVPLDAMQTVVSKLEEGDVKKELMVMVRRLLDQREKQQRLLAVAATDRCLEGAEFRQMPIVATKEELHGRQSEKDLPVNRIGIRYSKLSDYVHTHFKLLREDCIDSLRQGIAAYRRNCVAFPQDGAPGRSVQELRVYPNVRTSAVRCGELGIEYVFQFDVNGSGWDDTPEAWESSRRLMPGALLCISSDQFHTFLWGVVADRNVKARAKGLVAIRLVIQSEDDDHGGPGQQAFFLTTQTFVMVESTTAYFEAYSHVLRSLQREEMEDIPFTRHLLHLESVVQPPSYLLRRRERDEYDFSAVFSSMEEKMGRKSMRILQAWPAGLSDSLALDEAQLAALRQGLTKELAIIQGPPGTGKAFLGILLVKLLLANLERRPVKPVSEVDIAMNANPLYDLNGPILIICYTNHALDQFLEGLFKSGITNLIRVGGRSKSELLKERTLYYLLEQQRKSWKVDSNLRRFFGQARSRKDSLEEKIHKCIDTIGEKYVTYDLLEGVATNEQIHSLFGLEMRPGRVVSMQVVEFWLDQEWCGDGSIALGYCLRPTDFDRAGAGSLDSKAETLGKPTRGAIKELPKEEADEEEGWTQVRSRRRRTWQRAPVENQLAENFQELQDENGNAIMMAEAEEHEPEVIGHDAPFDEEVEDPLHGFVNAPNVWELGITQRRRLHAYWLDEIRSNCRRELRKLTEEYEEASKSVMEVENEIQSAMLRSAQVVGLTTTAAAKHNDVLKSLKSEIVVIEEAAEVLEGHILACLSPSVKHLILIGDHLQLRPSVAVYRLSKQCKLDVSMFERLVRSGIEHVTLQEQRRMRPSISKMMKTLYPDSKDHVSVHERKDVVGVLPSVFFFDHKAEERNSKGEAGSKVNPTEARLVVELCMYLLNQAEYGPENITILTMYSGQLLEIRRLLMGRCRNRLTIRAIGNWEETSEKEEENFQIPRVSSVDDFQGEESDIIILSLVRSNEIPTNEGRGRIGFLKIENRICVALTRAREGLFIFGNATLLADSSNLWKTVTDSLRNDGALGQSLDLYCVNHPHKRAKIAKVEDFKQVEDGGCNLACEHQLECGHACPRRCHRSSHDLVVCPKECLKRYDDCHHICNRRCHGEADCPPCPAIVRRPLINCNHSQGMICGSKLEDELCRSACENALPCGHQCHRLCGRPCSERCEELVTKMLPCGHSATMLCSQSVEAISFTSPCGILLDDCNHPCRGTCGKCNRGKSHIKCREKCGRNLPCGHSCEDKCSAPCPPCKKRCRKRCSHSRCPKSCGELCTPCRERCAWKCVHHECDKLCIEICTRPRCNLPCPEMRKCGHPCIGLCGERCPLKCRVCHPDLIETITLMREFEELDRFIQLEDCQHVFELSGLDTWMDSVDTDQQSDGSVAVTLKGCPECRAPIVKTTRYSNIVKKQLHQIEQVKRKVIGYNNLKAGNDCIESKDYIRALKFYRAALNQNPRLMEAQFQIGYVFFLTTEYAKAIMHLSFVLERSSFGKRLENLIRRVESVDSANANDNVSSGPIRALKRLLARSPGQTNDTLAIRAMVQLASTLACSANFTDSRELCDVVLERDPENVTAQDIKEKAGKGEAALVIQAMAKDVGERGHWFQCPNGHFYTIGECGGAMQESKCPNCSATVGGHSHRLSTGNRPSDIDGSNPLWYQWSGHQRL